MHAVGTRRDFGSPFIRHLTSLVLPMILSPNETFSLWKKQVKVLVTQSCPTLCDPMDCSLPGSSVHGILQIRTLEWVAIPFSRWSSWPRNWSQVSCIAGTFITVWATREAQKLMIWEMKWVKWEGRVGDKQMGMIYVWWRLVQYRFVALITVFFLCGLVQALK